MAKAYHWCTVYYGVCQLVIVTNTAAFTDKLQCLFQMLAFVRDSPNTVPGLVCFLPSALAVKKERAERPIKTGYQKKRMLRGHVGSHSKLLKINETSQQSIVLKQLKY